MAVTVLPSPETVGDVAVTRINFPRRVNAGSASSSRRIFRAVRSNLFVIFFRDFQFPRDVLNRKKCFFHLGLSRNQRFEVRTKGYHIGLAAVAQPCRASMATLAWFLQWRKKNG